jgi:hypothetical protein
VVFDELSLEFVDQLSDNLVAQAGAEIRRLQLDFVLEPQEKEHVGNTCVVLAVGCIVFGDRRCARGGESCDAVES